MKFVHKPQNQIWYVSQLLKSVQIRSKAVCTAIAVDVTPTWRLRWYLKIKKRWDPRVSKCSVKNKKILVGPTFFLSFFFCLLLLLFMDGIRQPAVGGEKKGDQRVRVKQAGGAAVGGAAAAPDGGMR
jgi:hypothetical protein